MQTLASQSGWGKEGREAGEAEGGGGKEGRRGRTGVTDHGLVMHALCLTVCKIQTLYYMTFDKFCLLCFLNLLSFDSC